MVEICDVDDGMLEIMTLSADMTSFDCPFGPLLIVLVMPVEKGTWLPGFLNFTGEFFSLSTSESENES